jgi:hypothetical protein
MQFRLFTVGFCILLGAVLLSGVLNNFLSALCVFVALVCWFALERAKRGTALGIALVLGWLLVAGLIAAAFRQSG